MLPPDFLSNAPAAPAAIQELRGHLPASVPSDYFDLLATTNGGEGFVGNTYVIFFAAEDVLSLNAAYHVSDLAPGFFLIGSNAIGDAIVFDCRTAVCRLVLVPFIPLMPDVAEPIGSSITEFLDAQLLDAPDPPLKPNPAAIGKEVHDIKPMAFGGDPNDLANKAFVPRQQHAELVVFWNQTYQRLTASRHDA
jgi:hypothetical protein